MEFQRSLGPGYGLNGMWFGWQGLTGRVDDCIVAEGTESIDDQVRAQITESSGYEAFGKFVQDYYHSVGHNNIGEQCALESNTIGPMEYSETSARDPIFWRWHKYLEDIFREFRDSRLNR